MGQKLDGIIGKEFGRLLSIYETKPHVLPCGKKPRRFLCLCNCGEYTEVALDNLRHGRVKSCGCLQREKASRSQYKHGHTGNDKPTPTYMSWYNMKQRCHNPNNDVYKYYGGRGITVCDGWLDSFENFLEDMGERPEGTSIDRINNDGNYDPSNCRWTTKKEQARNRRKRVNQKLT